MAEYTWTGSVSSNLNDPLNFNPNGNPTVGDSLTIPAGIDIGSNWPDSGSITCDNVLVDGGGSELYGGDFRGTPIFINWSGSLYGGYFTNMINNNVVWDANQYGDVYNYGHFRGGDYSNANFVENRHTIFGTYYQCPVYNYNLIVNGTFFDTFQNLSGEIQNGTFKSSVLNNAIITLGIFEQSVDNDGGTLNGGTYLGEVINRNGSTVNAGSFSSLFTNRYEVYGGSFTKVFQDITLGGSILIGDFSLLDEVKIGTSPTFTKKKGINSPILMAA